NGEEGFDLLTKAFQKVPAAMRGELPEIINEYGTFFQYSGFDGSEAMGLLVAASEQGRWALDKTGDTLKEFGIRAPDGSKTTTEAYTSIGLNAQEMATDVASGGDAAQNAMRRTAEALLQIEDPSERSQQANALFGTPLEDMSTTELPQCLSAL